MLSRRPPTLPSGPRLRAGDASFPKAPRAGPRIGASTGACSGREASGPPLTPMTKASSVTTRWWFSGSK
eukprot:4471331-Alexandrium_andersonii.AAC.1